MQYDIGIIGSGPGGYVAAIRAAQLGRSVVLIEESQLGGICLNWGCIPTKSLLKSAQVWSDLSTLAEHGISVEKPSFDLSKMVERSRRISQSLGKGVEGLMRKHGVQVISGRGTITTSTPDAVHVQVFGAAPQRLTLKKLILATGARARTLPLDLPEFMMWGAKEAMTPSHLPKKLLVIGAGAIGMEFASFYQALGTEVTVVEQGERILPQEDEECTQLAQQTFQKKGMKFMLGMQVSSVTCKDEQVHVVISNDQGSSETWTGNLSKDRVLVAIGVIGNTENLGLEHTTVQVHQGHIVVDAAFQTHHANICAIGDVIGTPWLAHLASHQGISCVEHIVLGHGHAIDVGAIPGCTYTLPALASFGLTEAKAKTLYDIKVGRFSFSGNGQALAQGAGTGLVKLVFEAKTGELLGAHLFGKESPELLGALLVARGLEATAEALSHVMFPHPTMSEMLHEAVLSAQGRVLHG
jgi:dihydrolipoamide dehydrogenase